jgi:PleD family two-component response regulator
MTLLAGLLAGAPRRPGDLTARLEGAAIGIVLTGADTGAAEKFGARLCGQVHGLGIPHADAGIDGVVTVSIGLAASTATEGGRPVELIGRASEALLAAKSGGGNRVVASA